MERGVNFNASTLWRQAAAHPPRHTIPGTVRRRSPLSPCVLAHRRLALGARLRLLRTLWEPRHYSSNGWRQVLFAVSGLPLAVPPEGAALQELAHRPWYVPAATTIWPSLPPPAGGRSQRLDLPSPVPGRSPFFLRQGDPEKKCLSVEIGAAPARAGRFPSASATSTSSTTSATASSARVRCTPP